LGDAGTWTFTLTVTPSTISQIGLTTDTTTVDGSSGVHGQLTTSGSNGGGVTFVATTGNTTSLKVSTGGPVSTSGYLKVGSYTFGGTDTDADGDTGPGPSPDGHGQRDSPERTPDGYDDR